MYGVTVHVPVPSEFYLPVHRAVMEVVQEQGGAEGLVLHLAYRTEQGFDIVEVWDSRDDADAFNATVMPQAMQRAGVPMDGPASQVEEFDPLGVMTPGGRAAAEGAAGSQERPVTGA